MSAVPRRRPQVAPTVEKVPKVPSIQGLTEELIGVKQNCKKAYNFLGEANRRMGNAEKMLEDTILQTNQRGEDYNIYGSILLRTLECYERSKVVATFHLWKKVKAGEYEWDYQTLDKNIHDDEEWKVSVVRAGEKVRVHLTKEGIESVKEQVEELFTIWTNESENPKSTKDENGKLYIKCLKFYE